MTFSKNLESKKQVLIERNYMSSLKLFQHTISKRKKERSIFCYNSKNREKSIVERKYRFAEEIQTYVEIICSVWMNR